MRKNLINRPTIQNSAHQHAMGESENPRPFAQIMYFAAECIERIFLNWSGQGTLDTPTTLNASFQSAFRYALKALPFCDSQPTAFIFQKHISSSIEIVLGGSNPPDILRRIWPIIVDSVDLMMRRRPMPHVLKEGFETLPPALAYCNSAASIARIILTMWVRTSRFHIRPSLIFRAHQGTLSPDIVYVGAI